MTGAASRPAAASGAAPAPVPAIRHDGWTADRQRRFLAAVAEGHTVGEACRLVGLSQASAYAFRRRAGGQAFALGWAAAGLLARDRLADELMARAIDGQVDTYTKADGATVTRHRHDNRLAMAMLARLDRLADGLAMEAQGMGAAPAAPPARPAAAAIVAGDWEPYLDEVVLGQAADAAAAFLADRTPDDEDAPASQLPQLRTRRARAEDDDEAFDDLDEDEEPDDDDDDDDEGGDDVDREAAGRILRAGDVHGRDDDPPLPPALREAVAAQARDRRGDFWRDDNGDILTHLPPPPLYSGQSTGTLGQPDFCRTATARERAAYRRGDPSHRPKRAPAARSTRRGRRSRAGQGTAAAADR